MTPAPAAQPAEAPTRRPRRWRDPLAGGAILIAGAASALALWPAGDRPDDQAGPPAGQPPTAAYSPTIAISRSLTPGATSAAARTATSAPSPSRSPKAPATAAVATASAKPAAKAEAGPITAYSACTSATTAAFNATFTVPFSWQHVFINADGDTSTGYRVPTVSGGLGADYMVENNALYRSTGSGWSWSQVSGTSPLVTHTGGTYQWRVPLSAIGSPQGKLTVVFNGSGGSPEAYTELLETQGC